MRSRLVAWFEAGLAAIDLRRGEHDPRADEPLPGRDIERDTVDRLAIVALGKAGAALADRFGADLEDFEGLAITPDPPLVRPELWEHIAGGHPEPTLASFRAARRALELVGSLGGGDGVLFLVSGGGSSLMELPIDPAIDLDDCRAFHRGLVRSGASIEAINRVRAVASAVKGGRLAEAAAPARQWTVVVSDVPRGRPELVASGPSFPPPVTDPAEVNAILRRHDLVHTIPERYRAWFAGLDRSTLALRDGTFDRSTFVTLVDNEDALRAIEARLNGDGFVTERLCLQEEATVDDAVSLHLRAIEGLAERHPGEAVAIVSGGEVTVPVRGHPGIGGRNQSLVLAMALAIEGAPLAFLSAGTDGIDGNSSAAGAVADGTTVARARAAGCDPRSALSANDAGTLFASIGDAIVTGPTGNNVRDVRILVRPDDAR
ncbi:MAG: DUF4147 domain-containing protein [Planctomycetes bacterium]|nr:DUF4147 domain-containing protein [Planctomycetota bacterium]